MSERILTDKDFAYAAQYPGLGPHYWPAQRIVEAALKPLTSDDAKVIAERVATQIYQQIVDATQDALWQDAEMNLQSKMWHMVDEIVRAILSGNLDVINRYVLGNRYDCEEVRKAVASQIPQEIMTARIADLEGENERLKDALQREKRYNQ
jgi:hypothetical protein